MHGRTTHLVLLLSVAACSGDPDEPRKSNDPETSAGVLGDGTADSVSLTAIFEPAGTVFTTDVEFNSQNPRELWAVQRPAFADEPCTMTDDTGCRALIGRTVIIADATGDAPSAQTKIDPNAWHFMRRPTSIAFGPQGLFATCHEARTGNFTDESVDYIGPTLWSSDPSIYAIEPEGKNGSHLDMLHETPFCMGIAHEDANAYFAFNGNIGGIDRYDFNEPHEIGGEDHSDGKLLRYVEGELERVADVPSHLAYDRAGGLLFIADTGNARVAVLDVNSGTPGAEIAVVERMQQGVYVDGATLTDFVAPGTLQQPSGIALFESVVLVTDAATSRIWAFDRDGGVVNSLDTGLPSGSLAGITVGPDRRVYLADLKLGRVLRVTPR